MACPVHEQLGNLPQYVPYKIYVVQTNLAVSLGKEDAIMAHKGLGWHAGSSKHHPEGDGNAGGIPIPISSYLPTTSPQMERFWGRLYTLPPCEHVSEKWGPSNSIQ